MRVGDMLTTLGVNPDVNSLIVMHGKHNVKFREMETGDIFFFQKKWRTFMFLCTRLEDKKELAYCASSEDHIFTLNSKECELGFSVAMSYLRE